MHGSGSGVRQGLSYRWVMFCILGVIYFLACLHRISPTVIAKDLGLAFGADATALGLMNPAAFFSTALFQPLSGLIMDAVGRKGSAYPLEAYEHVFVAIFISAVLALLAISPLRIPRKSG